MEVRVVIQHHRGTTGGITERLWLSQAAAHLCYFCLCDDILAVPILLIFFFFSSFPKHNPETASKLFPARSKGLKREARTQASVYAIQIVTGAQSKTHTHLFPAPGTWVKQQCPCRAQEP